MVGWKGDNKNIIFLCVLCVFVVNNLHSSIGAKRHDCCGQKSTPTFRDRDVAPTKGRMQFAPTKKSSVTSVVNHLVEFSG